MTKRPISETNSEFVTSRTFNTYAEVQSYFAEQAKKYGKLAYCSTSEFAALKPIMDKLYAAEGHVYVRPRRLLRSICISL
jgi:hypothetical protein